MPSVFILVFLSKYHELKKICKLKKKLFISLVRCVLSVKKHSADLAEDAACFEFGLVLTSFSGIWAEGCSHPALLPLKPPVAAAEPTRWF